MSKQGWVETLIASQVDGPAVGNSTTNSSILTSQSRYTFPNGFFDAPGRTIRINARGRVTANSTLAATLTLDVRLGAGPVIIANTTGLTLGNTTSTQITNAAWELEATITLRASGNTANVMTIGSFTSATVTPTTNNVAGVFVFPSTAPATSPVFDATAAQLLDMQATWSVNNANNTITCHMFTLEALN